MGQRCRRELNWPFQSESKQEKRVVQGSHGELSRGSHVRPYALSDYSKGISVIVIDSGAPAVIVLFFRPATAHWLVRLPLGLISPIILSRMEYCRDFPAELAVRLIEKDQDDAYRE